MSDTTVTIKRLTSSDASRAVVIFAGWGMDYRPFASLRKDGYDIFVVYDYGRNDRVDSTQLQRYSEICIIAWSWGVPAGAEFISSHSHLPITGAIAVNGTMTPIDDRFGIPENIFRSTLDNLSDSSLLKFYRRMCGSAAPYRTFAQAKPERSITSLRDELEAIRDNGASTLSPLIFDRVIIGSNDYVIPTANQQNAWDGHPAITVTDSPHLPDFQNILNLYVRDKSLIGWRFSGATCTYPEEARVQKHIASHLYNLWRDCDDRQNESILELGVGCGFMTQHYIDAPRCQRATLIDLYDGMDGVEAGDAECYLPSRSKFDTIVSASTMQWFNSPRRFLKRAADSLTEDGMIVMSGFGHKHFHELDGLVPRALFYYPTEDFAKIIPPELQLVKAEEETITVKFPTIREMLDHLRLTGVNAISSGHTIAITRRILTAMESQNDITLTYNPTYYIIKRRPKNPFDN